ncbi:MAG: TetR/AcrR family transcriptional regulator [Candidatus Cloacimonadales bacterium]|jgi:AcrR family transcriptional regulator|nr:TetR/AcrR family transcriptional regulator [Candidatus Cloacimonadota bacterium]MDD2650588.1 TetR/AcrR family transcriptional regulator [Candidatus Cloacimonadota bacterium]MDD3500867.1 TetR/AcrR family transcriptional regulator [Candidatus Cloacimonadota bacterium]MDX9976796.1 TetR/AcrR family transcriptional regulator [Candidatus Cloacimonadales bacterium]
MNWTERQKELIIKTIAIIAQHGIQEFTTKNLAKNMGISEAAIYRHFQSKNEILSNIIDYLDQISDETLNESNQSQFNSFEKAKNFVLSRFKLFSRQPDLAHIMFNNSIFKNDFDLSCKMFSLMSKHQSYLFNNIKKAKEEGIITADIDKDTIFLIIIGPVRLLVNQWIMSKCAFDLEIRGLNLVQELEKLLKK